MRPEYRTCVLRTLSKLPKRLDNLLRLRSAETGQPELFIRDRFAMVGTVLSRDILITPTDDDPLTRQTVYRYAYVVKIRDRD